MGIKTEVKIDVSQLGLTLSPGTSYRIEVEEGFTKEDGGEEQPSPANTNLYSFTTNATGPVAQSGSSTVPNMKIKFDRKIFKNTGTIRLYKNGSTLVHTFDINDPTVTITYATGSATTANDALNVNLTGYITDGSTTYHLLADAGVVKDGDNFPSLAITSSSLADYSTGPAPLISTVYPTYNTVNFEDNTKVQLNFNSSILAGAADGSKLIRLYQSPSNTLVHAFDPDSNEVTISGSSAVIKTTGYLKANTEYYMTIDAGAFKTVGGIWLNAVGQGTIKFTTANATFPDLSAGLQSAFSATADLTILPVEDYFVITPSASTYIEDTTTSIQNTPRVSEYTYNGNSNYSVTITPVPDSAVVTLSSTGTGGSRTFNSTTKVLTLTGNKSAINSYLAGLTMTTAIDYANNITLNYHVVSPTGTITDKSQVLSAGAPFDTEVSNIINFDRNYVGGEVNLIFEYNTPEIIDFDQSVSRVYEISLSSPVGRFASLANYSDAAATWTYSGTAAQVTQKFLELKFLPNKLTNSDSYFTYVQKKNGVVQVSVNVNLLGTAPSPSVSRTVVFDTVGSFTFQPTLEEEMFSVADVLIVGGGGGGTAGFGGGTGGGGGRVVQLSNLNLTNQNYPIVVGAGGFGVSTKYPNTSSIFTSNAGSGGSSSAIGSTAAGGKGGSWVYNNPGFVAKGGNSGADLFQGGTSSSQNYGGAGAGASQNGTSSTTISGDPNTFGGKGGDGVLSSITGTYYGGGGGGAPRDKIDTATSVAGLGGLGGGGIAGAFGTNGNGANGVAATGGGGGGCGGTYQTGSSTTAGNGGSGIVIIRMKNS